MNNILSITLDLNRDNPTVTAKQNDAGSRYILATITSKGTELTVPDGAVVSLKAVKPDGHCTMTAGAVQEGKVLVGLTNQTLAVPGTAICELQIIGSEQPSVLKTIRFFLNIDAEVYSDDVPESTDEFTALTETMSDYAELREKVGQLDEEVQNLAITSVSINNVEIEPVDKNINIPLATNSTNGAMSKEQAASLATALVDIAELQDITAGIEDLLEAI